MEQTAVPRGVRRVALVTLLLTAASTLAIASCSLDDSGLFVEPPKGSGGRGAATGGTIGGSPGSGGATGSGGIPVGGSGSGGDTGGDTGTGGSASGGSGASVGSGGDVPPGSGGIPASGGMIGSSTGGAAGMSVSSGGSAGQMMMPTGGRGGQMPMPGGRGGAAGGAGGEGGCGPKTCANGCCEADRCVTLRTADRCGANGAACVKCANSCFRCSTAGSCEVNPTSSWRMACVGATIAPTTSTGDDWDPSTGGGRSGGPGTNMSALPDPVCELVLDNQGIVGSTSLLTDTLNPHWNESITPAPTPLTASLLMSQNTYWAIVVYDDDERGGYDYVCRVVPQLSASDFVSGDVTFSNVQSCTSLNVHLTCVP